MAHYALLDENNIVVNVIVGRDEDEIVDGVSDWEAHYSDVTGLTVLRTSYNTNGGVHSDGGTPLRKNYAGVGMSYDESRDAFIPVQPYPSWILDEDSCLWVAPVALPDDADTVAYVWDEASTSWVGVE